MPAFSPSMTSTSASIGVPVCASLMTPESVKVRAASLTCSDTLDPWYAAVTSASPRPTPATFPLLETVTTAVFDDCHVACAVTSCVVPFDSDAVAVNCAVSPTAGAVPVIVSEFVVGAVGVGVVGVDALGVGVLVPPHATPHNIKIAVASARPRIQIMLLRREPSTHLYR